MDEEHHIVIRELRYRGEEGSVRQTEYQILLNGCPAGEGYDSGANPHLVCELLCALGIEASVELDFEDMQWSEE